MAGLMSISPQAAQWILGRVLPAQCHQPAHMRGTATTRQTPEPQITQRTDLWSDGRQLGQLQLTTRFNQRHSARQFHLQQEGGLVRRMPPDGSIAEPARLRNSRGSEDKAPKARPAE